MDENITFEFAPFVADNVERVSVSCNDVTTRVSRGSAEENHL
jgi:hypothetical protein